MNLLLSELNRFRSRRAVVLLLVLGFLLSLLIAGTTIWQNRPFDEDELAQARAQAMEQATSTVKACEKHPRRYVGSDPAQCQQFLDEAQQHPEYFTDMGRYPASFDSTAQDLPLTLMATLAFLALLAGTTFVGADIAAGAMSNTLLFRPNRWQVWAAKLAATVLWTTLVAAVTLAICLLALAQTASSDPELGMVGGDATALAWRGLRVLVVTVVAAALGAAVTSALRSTIATVGVVIGYLLLGEALMRGIFGYAIEPWLASSRVFAFVRPRLVITDYDGIRPDTVLNMWPSALYLGVIALVVGAVCAVVFSRRDVP
jgi:ABC-2 type transport system permease protein